jgi:hypothetical protein
MIKKTYKTKFGLMQRGDRRADGFRFHGFNGKGYEQWSSPQSWAHHLTYSRKQSRQAYQQIKKNPTLLQRKLNQQTRWHQEHPASVLLNSARQRAKHHHVPCTITEADIRIPKYCPALGIKLVFKLRAGQKNRENSPSLDRIIPARGYIPNNVVVVSELANRIKTNATPEQILRVGKFYLNLWRHYEI